MSDNKKVLKEGKCEYSIVKGIGKNGNPYVYIRFHINGYNHDKIVFLNGIEGELIETKLMK